MILAARAEAGGVDVPIEASMLSLDMTLTEERVAAYPRQPFNMG
jgi:hypothetical protein